MHIVHSANFSKGTQPMSEHPFYALALQAEQQSNLLAPVLRAYLTCEHLDAQQLAHRLGCPIEVLPRLWLCDKPRADHFEADIQRIADTCSVDAEELAQIIRQAS
jgi:hypothetical protein